MLKWKKKLSVIHICIKWCLYTNHNAKRTEWIDNTAYLVSYVSCVAVAVNVGISTLVFRFVRIRSLSFSVDTRKKNFSFCHCLFALLRSGTIVLCLYVNYAYVYTHISQSYCNRWSRNIVFNDERKLKHQMQNEERREKYNKKDTRL